MGQALVGINAMAGARALADQDAVASDHRDEHASGVGDTPAAFAITPNRAFVFRHATANQRAVLPAVKAKDAVGLCNHLPPLEIADATAAVLLLAHIGHRR
jgi:hypothetical protein